MRAWTEEASIESISRLSVSRRQLLEGFRSSNVDFFLSSDKLHLEKRASLGLKPSFMSSGEMCSDMLQDMELTDSLSDMSLESSGINIDQHIQTFLDEGKGYMHIKTELQELLGRELIRSEKSRITSLAELHYNATNARKRSSKKKARVEPSVGRGGGADVSAEASVQLPAQSPPPQTNAPGRPKLTCFPPPEQKLTGQTDNVESSPEHMYVSDEERTPLANAMLAKHLDVPVFNNVNITDHYHVGDQLGSGAFCKVQNTFIKGPSCVQDLEEYM